MNLLKDCHFCTVSGVHENKPFAIPTGFCIYNDQLIIHGSIKSHFLELILASSEVCITSFIMDGLVLAASAFHHSVNYRSAVIFSGPTEIKDEPIKLAILKEFTEKYVPGRWDSLRPVNEGELKATRAIAFDLSKGSVKARSGPPSYEAADAKLGIWTGVLPTRILWEGPISDPNINPSIKVPEHVLNILNANNQ